MQETSSTIDRELMIVRLWSSGSRFTHTSLARTEQKHHQEAWPICRVSNDDLQICCVSWTSIAYKGLSFEYSFVAVGLGVVIGGSRAVQPAVEEGRRADA